MRVKGVRTILDSIRANLVLIPGRPLLNSNEGNDSRTRQLDQVIVNSIAAIVRGKVPLGVQMALGSVDHPSYRQNLRRDQVQKERRSDLVAQGACVQCSGIWRTKETTLASEKRMVRR